MPDDYSTDYSKMKDEELLEVVKKAQDPSTAPLGTSRALVDWLPLVLEVLRRLLERRQ
jgi:hypothetical protein